jgi:hypothetical protein
MKKSIFLVVVVLLNIILVGGCESNDSDSDNVSSEKSIISFSFELDGNQYAVSFDSERHGTVTVPYGTDVTSLVPTIVISAGSSINPLSGVAQDFTDPVTYTVSAADGSTAEYEVSVIVEDVSAIFDGADRLVETQNNDGTWEWDNPDTDKTDGPGASNTYGVTAMGLLGAYKVTGNEAYLDAAKITADVLVAKATDESDGNFYSQDIEFLARLGAITGDSTYSTKASEIMSHFMTQGNRYCSDDGCTAEELADFYAGRFPTPDDSGLTEWQLSSWVRAADLTGNSNWADEMVSEIADDVATEYFNISNPNQDYYSLGLSGVLDATGNDQIAQKLLEIQGEDGGWSSNNPEGSVQDTAYAIIALIKEKDSVNDSAITAAVNWLKEHQDETGGWKNDKDVENTELTSEALWAISDLYLEQE